MSAWEGVDKRERMGFSIKEKAPEKKKSVFLYFYFWFVSFSLFIGW
jgi:hypothetical protein